MTRRELMLATPAALLAQTPPALPQTPEEEMKAAREQQLRNGEQLAKFSVPMSTEPAFHFKP